MQIRELKTGTDHERVVECIDPSADYHAIIAIHSTVLGPAVGGTRVWSYPSVDAAVTDALRLSQGMTLKCAAAGLDFGGGKAVIMVSEPPQDREKLFRAHGRAIEELGGHFVTGEDVGSSPSDMAFVRKETRYVAGLPDRSGDPSPSTARGVFRAICAAAQHRWKSDSLTGRMVAVQGCGHVGRPLAHELKSAGAALVLSDVDQARAERTAAEVGGRTVSPDAIFDVEADIFAPCALGGILNEKTIPRLRVSIVAGAANNQLALESDEAHLARRNILYVPDFIANAGGVINGCREVAGWSDARSAGHIEGIYDTVLELLRRAEQDGITSNQAAHQLAEARLRRT